jgi:hypothetical protein
MSCSNKWDFMAWNYLIAQTSERIISKLLQLTIACAFSKLDILSLRGRTFNKTVGKFEDTLWSASVAQSPESRHLWMWNYVKGTDGDRGSYWFTSWYNIRSLGLLLLQRNISVELCTQNLVKYFIFSPIAPCRKGSGRTPGRLSRGTVNHWPDIFLCDK